MSRRNANVGLIATTVAIIALFAVIGCMTTPPVVVVGVTQCDLHSATVLITAKSQEELDNALGRERRISGFVSAKQLSTERWRCHPYKAEVTFGFLY